MKKQETLSGNREFFHFPSRQTLLVPTFHFSSSLLLLFVNKNLFFTDTLLNACWVLRTIVYLEAIKVDDRSP